jgi:predicted outer membrane protein
MNPRIAAICATALSLGAVAAGAGPATARATHSSAQDKTWLSTAMQGDRFEILGGQLAMSHSTDARVQQLGRRLMQDHTAALKAASAAAHSRGVDVPREPSPSEQWELDMLAQLHGEAFDRAYTSLEVKDHQQDISEATDESKGGRDGGVLRLARHAIGMYHRHLHLSEAAFDAVTKGG